MTRSLRPLSFVGAALAGGAVWLVVELLFLPLTKHVPADWIFRLIAALMAGPVTLTAPTSQAGALIAPALGMHAALSLAFGYGICRTVETFPLGRAVLTGVALGVLIYVFDFYVMTRLFPWFATVRGPVTVVAHVLFGFTTALMHKGLAGVQLQPSSTAEARPAH